MIRKLVDEYAADETGEADYALEANGKIFVWFESKSKKIFCDFLGGKIVDTRCTEYTDEPRQNVVKFLGIPIVHMSKQPNIMIKVSWTFFERPHFLSSPHSRLVVCLVNVFLSKVTKEV